MSPADASCSGVYPGVRRPNHLRRHLRAIFLTLQRLSPATRSQLRAVAGLGVELTAIIPSRDSGGVQLQHEMDGGLRVLPIASRGDPSDPAGFRWKRSALRRALHEARPEVVHLDVEPHLPAASAVMREARHVGAAVTAATAVQSRAALSWRERRRRSRNLRQARGIHAATPRAATLVGEEAEAPTLMAPRIGVIAPAEVAPFSPDGMVMAFGGRLVPARGLDLLLRSSVGVGGNWHLLVAGGGPAQPELESLAERMGISGRVSWLGSLPAGERAELWSRADCAVVPSREENAAVDHAAIGALQAMAAGRPVVATRTGAVPEFVGDSGILVEPDDTAALTAALQQLHDDPALRQSLGAAARQLVLEHYSTQAVARRAVELWRRVVAGV